MRILFIPYGTDQAPATRYRVTQYLPYLKKHGINYHVFSAISGFSTFLMIKSPDFAPLVRYMYYIYVFIERIIRFSYIAVMSKQSDIIFLQRTTFPLNLEILLWIINKNIVFDIDDAIYLPDKQGNDILTRIKKYVKKSEVINILKISRAVIVENEYIKEFVSQYCKNIYKIPGPIDTERFFVRPKFKNDNEVIIGWIGTPATTFYLYMLNNVFKDIKKKYDFVKFRFIGLGNYKNSDMEFEKIDWDYKTEVRNLQSFDIGIMPMPDNEWTRGKLGCKMLQYMAVGLASVISYTPTNAEIINDTINGFFVSGENKWVKILSMLIENEELRKTVGEKGRQTVEEKCSLSHNVNRLTDILLKINEKKS